MPINIYSQVNDKERFCIGENEWDLSSLLAILETWLATEHSTILSNDYVADIGFESNPSHAGGGGVLTSKSLERISNIGLELHFSEYPK